MDNTAKGAFLSFGHPAVRGSAAVIAEHAAALTWAFSLLAYVSVGAFMSPGAVVFLVPAGAVTAAAMAIRRRSKLPPRHRSGPAHTRR